MFTIKKKKTKIINIEIHYHVKKKKERKYINKQMNESKKEIKMKGRKKEKMTERSSTKNIKRMEERFLFHLTVTIREFFLPI
jgi:hypothetical protein